MSCFLLEHLEVLLLTEDYGIYLACIDLSTLSPGESSQSAPEEDSEKSTQTWDALEWWLASIVVHAPNSPVAIVGTHDDCAGLSLLTLLVTMRSVMSRDAMTIITIQHMMSSIFQRQQIVMNFLKYRHNHKICVWLRVKTGYPCEIEHWFQLTHGRLFILWCTYQRPLPACTALWGLPVDSRRQVHAEVHERITAFCKKLPELNEPPSFEMALFRSISWGFLGHFGVSWREWKECLMWRKCPTMGKPRQLHINEMGQLCFFPMDNSSMDGGKSALLLQKAVEAMVSKLLQGWVRL